VPLHSIWTSLFSSGLCRNVKHSNQHNTNDETHFVAPSSTLSRLIAAPFYRRNFPPRIEAVEKAHLEPYRTIMASKFGVTVPKSAHTRIFSLHTRDINKTRETREHDRLTSPKVNLCANRRIAVRKRERERERNVMNILSLNILRQIPWSAKTVLQNINNWLRT